MNKVECCFALLYLLHLLSLQDSILDYPADMFNQMCRMDESECLSLLVVPNELSLVLSAANHSGATQGCLNRPEHNHVAMAFANHPEREGGKGGEGGRGFQPSCRAMAMLMVLRISNCQFHTSRCLDSFGVLSRRMPRPDILRHLSPISFCSSTPVISLRQRVRHVKDTDLQSQASMMYSCRHDGGSQLVQFMNW